MFLDGIGSAPISKILIIASFCISLLLYFRIITTFQIYFNIDQIINNYELWRLFTSVFCFGQLSASSVLSIIKLIFFSINLESQSFHERPIDFIIFLLFGLTFLWIYASNAPVVYLDKGFSSYVLYYWGKRDPGRMDLLDNILLSPVLLSLFFLFCEFVTDSRNIIPDIIGYVSGHFFFFIHDVINLKYNLNLLRTPDGMNTFLSRLL